MALEIFFLERAGEKPSQEKKRMITAQEARKRKDSYILAYIQEAILKATEKFQNHVHISSEGGTFVIPQEILAGLEKLGYNVRYFEKNYIIDWREPGKK